MIAARKAAEEAEAAMNKEARSQTPHLKRSLAALRFTLHLQRALGSGTRGAASPYRTLIHPSAASLTLATWTTDNCHL